MGRIAAIGTEVVVRGFGLAGILVLAAEEDAQVREAWRQLPADVELVILTPAARRALRSAPAGPPLLAVIPS